MKQIRKTKHSQSLFVIIVHACVFLVFFNFKTYVLNAKVHMLGLARHHRAVLLQNAVKPVFNLDFRTALHLLRDLVPFRSALLPQRKDPFVFLQLPLFVAHRRVDSVDPALSTLARRAVWVFLACLLVELLCDLGPLFGLTKALFSLGMNLSGDIF